MKKKVFAVLGATGKIGNVISETLLSSGHRVLAIGRNKEKLNALKKLGAEIVATEFNNVDSLAKAFSGCDGVFTMISPDYGADDLSVHYDQEGQAIFEAIQKSKVKKVVSLSSLGANLPDKTGPVKGLHHQEKRLNKLSNVDILHFRPAFFMQNFFMSIPLMKSKGIIASAIKGDIPINMVSTKDIGKKIAQILMELSFSGKSVFEFVGPTQVPYIEATAILAKALNLPNLKYIQASYEDAEKAMVSAGMKPISAKLMVELHKSFNDGLVKTTQPITDDHKGLTTFANFAQEFAAVFNT